MKCCGWNFLTLSWQKSRSTRSLSCRQMDLRVECRPLFIRVVCPAENPPHCRTRHNGTLRATSPLSAFPPAPLMAKTEVPVAAESGSGTFPYWRTCPRTIYSLFSQFFGRVRNWRGWSSRTYAGTWKSSSTITSPFVCVSYLLFPLWILIGGGGSSCVPFHLVGNIVAYKHTGAPRAVVWSSQLGNRGLPVGTYGVISYYRQRFLTTKYVMFFSWVLLFFPIW